MSWSQYCSMDKNPDSIFLLLLRNLDELYAISFVVFIHFLWILFQMFAFLLLTQPRTIEFESSYICFPNGRKVRKFSFVTNLQVQLLSNPSNRSRRTISAQKRSIFSWAQFNAQTIHFLNSSSASSMPKSKLITHRFDMMSEHIYIEKNGWNWFLIQCCE